MQLNPNSISIDIKNTNQMMPPAFLNKLIENGSRIWTFYADYDMYRSFTFVVALVKIFFS